MENSIYHIKRSGPEADQEDILKAKTVQMHLNKCTEAKRLRDWNNLIKETKNTIASGADAATQVYALQADAFLKSYRHQEADDALSRCPVFDVEMNTKYYGPIGYAGFLVVWAQVHMSLGRFGPSDFLVFNPHLGVRTRHKTKTFPDLTGLNEKRFFFFFVKSDLKKRLRRFN